MSAPSSTRPSAAAMYTCPERWTYKPVRLVGQGSFGVVLLAKVEETGEMVAIKRVRYDSRLLNRELIIMHDILGDASCSGGAPTTSTATAVPSSSAVPPPHNTGTPKGNRPRSASFSQTSVGSARSSPDAHPPLLLPRHPNMVQLRTYYFNTDPETNERYLHLVMSYMPTDLQALKKQLTKAAPPSSQTARSGQPTSTATGTVGGGAGAAAKEEFSDPPTASGSVPGPTGNMPSSSFSSAAPRNRRFPLLLTKVILFQLARALAFLHSRQVCHRDVKPANVLVDASTGQVQLCDFGSAKQILRPAEEKNVSYICSRFYRAPELLFGALHYDTTVDMWSYGCIAAELLRDGALPLFRGSTTVDQMAEMFKVLGAPSTTEMHAMNPQCAEAMVRTHQQYTSSAGSVYPSATPATPAQTPAGSPPTRGATSTTAGGTGTTMDDSNATASAFSPTEDPASSPHYADEHSDYFDFYNVLKVKALQWSSVFPRETANEAVQLVSQLLCYTPGKRMSAVNVVEHPFFDDLFPSSQTAAGANPTATADASTAPEATTITGVSAEAMSSSDPVPPSPPASSSSSFCTASTCASAPLPRLPSGSLLPIEMYLMTEQETVLYSSALQEKMNREARRLVLERQRQQGTSVTPVAVAVPS